MRFPGMPQAPQLGVQPRQGAIKCKKPSIFVYNTAHVAELMKQLAGRRRNLGLAFLDFKKRHPVLGWS